MSVVESVSTWRADGARAREGLRRRTGKGMSATMRQQDQRNELLSNGRWYARESVEEGERLDALTLPSTLTISNSVPLLVSITLVLRFSSSSSKRFFASATLTR